MKRKSLTIVILFISFLSYCQISIDNKGKVIKYLDFVNNSMKGGSVSEALQSVSEFIPNNNIKLNYFEQNGTYWHSISNEDMGLFLDIKGVGEFNITTYIIALDKDLQKKDNILSVKTLLIFSNEFSSDEKLDELKWKIADIVDNYVKNKCLTGLFNQKDLNNVIRGGTEFKLINSFEIINPKYTIGYKENGNSNNLDCESWYAQLDLGFENKNSTKNENQVFIIDFENKIIRMFVK